MKYEYDVLTIGLGPAGMAVAVMASQMGLKVAAVEKHKIGGECMNVGCIPSKSLLKMAKHRNIYNKLENKSHGPILDPIALRPFEKVQEYLQFINEKKTVGMFKSVDLILGQGAAEFINEHTVAVGDRRLTARKIFIATGTKPMIPKIRNLREADPLTNETVFNLDEVPKSLFVIGGGPIACEMAQAFARLGSKVSMSLLSSRLMEHLVDAEVSDLMEARFAAEGIDIFHKTTAINVEPKGKLWNVSLENGHSLIVDKILVGAGRKVQLDSLHLERVGIKTHANGIVVNKFLQTSRRNIYAVGDCNGHALLSHAAMHQGMIALMNSMTPYPFKQDFRKFTIPWTVFTEPEVSCAGLTEKQLKERNITYETITVLYEDYGAAIAEGVSEGFLKVYTTRMGKIYGVTIVGEGSGNMINEWALAIQKGIRMHDIMMLQHSFPTMGFLSKRVSELWMQKRMKSPILRFMAKFMFRFIGR
jgi:pyruvate/2-oxoglutarate dehydrogenase complex dihydrolipoamide dehydrogenase (E3) component